MDNDNKASNLKQANYVPDLRPVTDDFCLLWKTDVLSFNGFNENLFSNSSARFSYLFSLNGFYRIGPEAIMIVILDL